MTKFYATARGRSEAQKDRGRTVRCQCVRCGLVRYLAPEDVGSVHFTQRDGYVCGPTGRFIQAKEP